MQQLRLWGCLFPSETIMMRPARSLQYSAQIIISWVPRSRGEREMCCAVVHIHTYCGTAYIWICSLLFLCYGLSQGAVNTLPDIASFEASMVVGNCWHLCAGQNLIAYICPILELHQPGASQHVPNQTDWDMGEWRELLYWIDLDSAYLNTFLGTTFIPLSHYYPVIIPVLYLLSDYNEKNVG